MKKLHMFEWFGYFYLLLAMVNNLFVHNFSPWLDYIFFTLGIILLIVGTRKRKKNEKMQAELEDRKPQLSAASLRKQKKK